MADRESANFRRFISLSERKNGLEAIIAARMQISNFAGAWRRKYEVVSFASYISLD